MRSPPNPGGGGISIAAHAKRIDVDNRIPLRIYFRIADNVLRQADIYREEKNILDLYIMLLRFSSLVTETIPKHREYHTSSLPERNYFKERNLKALNELESIKPAVQCQVIELNQSRNQASSWGELNQSRNQVSSWGELNLSRNQVSSWGELNQSRNQVSSWGQGFIQDNSLEWPPVIKQNFPRSENRQLQVSRSSVQEPQVVFTQSPHVYQNSFPQTRPPEEKFRKISLCIPRAKDETLSRHSILGPNGLHGQWQPPRVGKGVQYPINLDLTPIEFPSQEPSKPVPTEDNNDSAARKSALDEVLSLHIEEPCPVITPKIKETSDKLDIVRQPSPPPVLADVQDMISGTSSQVSDSVSQQSTSLEDEILRTESPLEVYISSGMMDTFMRLAKSNTTRNLETCGVLAGSLKSRKFYVTDLIIPKQESTSDSCQTTDEEEIFDYQDKKSLFPLGWIHTHPTQSCFMSSIDVHTHYSYQIMLPQAIAIVMAPTDPSRKHGIFRLTTPGGMSVIRHCNQRGFHPHDQPKDGSPIYDRCADVFMDPRLKFDVVDFR